MVVVLKLLMSTIVPSRPYLLANIISIIFLNFYELNGATLSNVKKHSKPAKWVNPEESFESEPFQGLNIYENDILVPKKRIRRREVNAIRQWPSKIIPFEIDPAAGFMRNETDMLMLAFQEFADKTCVHFVPRQNERDYVFITTDPKRGCLSYIGFQGGKQEVYLLRPNCFYLKGTVIHELMHTIGFYHEHSRPDRDDHINVIWDNIRPEKASNFQIEQSGNMLGAPYDYLSVMHYSALTFSKDSDSKQYTMVPKDPDFAADRLGQRLGFSLIDTQQINRFYTCNKNTGILRPVIDFGAPPISPVELDPDASSFSGEIAKIQVREPRDQRFLISGRQDEGDLQDPSQSSSFLPAPLYVDLPVTVSVQPVAEVQSAKTDALCSGTFFPNAVLSFLGYFYIFKDRAYWRFTYANGIFAREPNFPQAYSANFNADMPAQLDSVFSYLTYIYFVQGSHVWVAKSDTEIRGPVELMQLFPGLPDTSWDNIFSRGTVINFILGSFSWVYDVPTDTVIGPTKTAQNALLTKGPVAELSDGRLIVFPRSNEPPSPEGDIYLLDRFTGKLLPGYPRSVSATFC